jgi:hypothetical protein
VALWLASPATAAVLAVLVLLLVAAVVPLTLVARQDVLSNFGYVAPFLPIAAVGLVIARHRPRNPIGWLLIATAASALLTEDAELYVWLVYRLGRHLPMGPAALLFRTPRPPSRELPPSSPISVSSSSLCASAWRS